MNSLSSRSIFSFYILVQFVSIHLEKTCFSVPVRGNLDRIVETSGSAVVACISYCTCKLFILRYSVLLKSLRSFCDGMCFSGS